jgi:hypothetical protein
MSAELPTAFTSATPTAMPTFATRPATQTRQYRQADAPLLLLVGRLARGLTGIKRRADCHAPSNRRTRRRSTVRPVITPVPCPTSRAAALACIPTLRTADGTAMIIAP